jgi:hypothetical protein
MPCPKCGGKPAWKHNLSPAQWIECERCGYLLASLADAWNALTRWEGEAARELLAAEVVNAATKCSILEGRYTIIAAEDAIRAIEKALTRPSAEPGEGEVELIEWLQSEVDGAVMPPEKRERYRRIIASLSPRPPMGEDTVSGRSGADAPSGSRPEDGAESSFVSAADAASILNAEDVLFTGAHPTSDGGFEFGFRDGVQGGIIHVIAAHLAEMMRLDSDKPLNCVQMDVQPAGKPALTLTMQRAGGKTPLRLKAEAEDLLRKALAALDSMAPAKLKAVRRAIKKHLAAVPPLASAMSAGTAETNEDSAPAEGSQPGPEGHRPETVTLPEERAEGGGGK